MSDFFGPNRPPLVSQADAEAGTSTTIKSWTPERVSQSIAALGLGNNSIQKDGSVAWTGPQNMGNQVFTNANSITSTSLIGTRAGIGSESGISAISSNPSIQIRNTAGDLNQKAWSTSTEGNGKSLNFNIHNDANSVRSTWLSVHRLVNTLKGVSFGTNATPVTEFPILQTTQAGALRGISLVGDSLGGFNGTSGIHIFNGVNVPGNRQLWIGDTDDAGDASKNSFRGTLGIDVPNFGGVNNNGTTNKNISFGNPLSRVGVGFPVLTTVQSDIESAFHVRQGETDKEMLFLDGISGQTADFMRLRDNNKVVKFSVNKDGNTTLNKLTLNNGISFKRKASGAADMDSSNANILAVNNTAAPRTVTLLTADVIDGTPRWIKDESGGAFTNNITIVTEGSETIDGATTKTISADFGDLTVYSNGTNWFVRNA